MKERLSLTPGSPRFTARRLENPEDKVNPEEHETYRSRVGTLLLLTKHNRPDIRNPVRELSKTMDADTFYTKIPIAPCYCQMMGRTLKEEIKITQYNNPTKAGKYSLEDLFRASDNITHHYPKF